MTKVRAGAWASDLLLMLMGPPAGLLLPVLVVAVALVVALAVVYGVDKWSAAGKPVGEEGAVVETTEVAAGELVALAREEEESTAATLVVHGGDGREVFGDFHGVEPFHQRRRRRHRRGVPAEACERLKIGMGPAEL